MEFSIAALLISCIANIILGGLVLIRRPQASSFGFVFIALFTVLWSISNFLTEYNFSNIEYNKAFNGLAYVFPMLIIVSVLCFALTFNPTRAARKILLFLCPTFIVAVPLSALHSIHGDVTRVNGKLTYSVGSLLDVYLLVIVAYLLVAMARMVIIARQEDRQRSDQAKIMLVGILTSIMLVGTTNALIPLVANNYSGAKFSYIFTLFFTYATAYAIIKHRLFDVRLIVARTIGYVLSLGTITLLFFASTVLLVQFAFDGSNSFFAHSVVPISLAIFVGLTYPKIKIFFDRFTNRIFYRDAYDPQVFLDQLNKTLVGNIEIGILLRHTASVIEENLKAECRIVVRETETSPSRMMGAQNMGIKQHEFEFIKSELATIGDKTVVANQLEEHYTDLRNTLEKRDVAVVSSLVTSYAASKEATAYLILGPKKSGNAYSKQDIRIIDIISDELLIAIQNALRFEEIQSFNITLQNRINDATAKLKRSNEKLKEMDGTKDEFISMASHQLRTPLTSVKGYLSMVLDGDVGEVSEAQQQMLNQAYISSQRMVYLIADLLNVSRLKTGKFIIDKAPTDLADMVAGEISQLNEVAKSRRLTLSFNRPDDFPILMLDETKTRQVVMNFVDNAIYYTPAGGKIKIELRSDRSSVYFMVKDNGLGVPKDEQAHLFSKFYRAKNAQKARPDGTGLGLFMAKKVVTEQGGTILFESTENKGSTFGFKFDRPKEPVML